MVVEVVEVVEVVVVVEVEEGLTQVMEPLADDSETKMSGNTIPTFTSGMHDLLFIDFNCTDLNLGIDPNSLYGNIETTL